MKKDIYFDNYCLVVFCDILVDKLWLVYFCVFLWENVSWEDGNEYLLVKLEIFSEFYLFFMGKMKFVDMVGCIDKFNKKFVKFVKK